MKVKLYYLVERDCLNAHVSTGRKGKQGVMEHDEAKAYFGTPCDPGVMTFFQIVEENEVMDRVKVVMDLGHKVEIEYLEDE